MFLGGAGLNIRNKNDTTILYLQVTGCRCTHVTNSHYQLPSTDPPQGTAEPLAQDSGIFMNMYLRQGRMLLGREE